jgi:hypothetical protein
VLFILKEKIMLIKNINKFVNQIIHKQKSHKVVEGIADVPNTVAEDLLSYPSWTKVVEPVKDEILKELHKVEKVPEVVELKGKDKK